jgi:Arc-like DNA binding dprotein
VSEAEQRTAPRLLVRLPPDVRQWLRHQAERNSSSQSSEAVRAIRARMESERQG